MNNVPPQFNNNPNQNQSSDQGFSQNNQGYYQNQNCNQGFNQGCNQGYNQNYNQGYNQGGNPNFNSWYCNDAFSTSPVTGKSRGVAALLAILLGHSVYTISIVVKPEPASVFCLFPCCRAESSALLLLSLP